MSVAFVALRTGTLVTLASDYPGADVFVVVGDCDDFVDIGTGGSALVCTVVGGFESTVVDCSTLSTIDSLVAVHALTDKGPGVVGALGIGVAVVVTAQEAFVGVGAGSAVAGVAFKAVTEIGSFCVFAVCRNITLVRLGRALVDVLAGLAVSLVTAVAATSEAADSVATSGICITIVGICVAL